MLTYLELQNFRNYPELELNCEAPVNVITGANGQGKTSFLEAIFFLSMLRSFRTSQVRDLKTIGTNGFYIKGEFLFKNWNWKKAFAIEYFRRRRLTIDKAPITRSSEFIRQIKTVVFSPDDILIINGSSFLRRRFVDMLLATLDLHYLQALQTYQTALNNRNALLKMADKDETLIDIYDGIMAENGSYIVDKRVHLSGLLTTKINALVNRIAKEETDISFQYQCVDGTLQKETFLNRLRQERIKDINRGFTGIGPQQDDMNILMNSKLLRNFGSTGQCRLLALCLKMAKLELLNENEEQADNIIALVDDVTGELDLPTKTAFYDVISHADQLFFTFTEPPQEGFFKDADVFSVKNNSITKRVE